MRVFGQFYARPKGRRNAVRFSWASPSFSLKVRQAFTLWMSLSRSLLRRATCREHPQKGKGEPSQGGKGGGGKCEGWKRGKRRGPKLIATLSASAAVLPYMAPPVSSSSRGVGRRSSSNQIRLCTLLRNCHSQLRVLAGAAASLKPSHTEPSVLGGADRSAPCCRRALQALLLERRVAE